MPIKFSNYINTAINYKHNFNMLMNRPNIFIRGRSKLFQIRNKIAGFLYDVKPGERCFVLGMGLSGDFDGFENSKDLLDRMYRDLKSIFKFSETDVSRNPYTSINEMKRDVRLSLKKGNVSMEYIAVRLILTTGYGGSFKVVKTAFESIEQIIKDNDNNRIEFADLAVKLKNDMGDAFLPISLFLPLVYSMIFWDTFNKKSGDYSQWNTFLSDELKYLIILSKSNKALLENNINKLMDIILKIDYLSSVPKSLSETLKEEGIKITNKQMDILDNYQLYLDKLFHEKMISREEFNAIEEKKENMPEYDNWLKSENKEYDLYINKMKLRSPFNDKNMIRGLFTLINDVARDLIGDTKRYDHVDALEHFTMMDVSLQDIYIISNVSPEIIRDILKPYFDGIGPLEFDHPIQKVFNIETLDTLKFVYQGVVFKIEGSKIDNNGHERYSFTITINKSGKKFIIPKRI